MTKDKSILIKNIYYMLAYAFQSLRQNNYEEVQREEFEKTEDLFAAILSKGIAQQLKRGLHREYISNHETMPVMRGKLDLPESMKLRIQRKQQLACEYDELSENNLFNQILKTTMHYLLQADGVAAKRKAELKKEIVFFDTVDNLEPKRIPWVKLYYQRNNESYELLINICYFVLHGMLMTTEKGDYKVMAFSDEQMERVYERFILAYYQQHHKYLTPNAGQVRWDLAETPTDEARRFLPIMQTDIMLKYREKTLIIDAKYYGKILQGQFKESLHSGNLYQIFTYVKNEDKANTGNVAGLLLYAKTDEEDTPYGEYNMGGNMIMAKTLDLNQEFSGIAKQLDDIVSEYFAPGDILAK